MKILEPFLPFWAAAALILLVRAQKVHSAESSSPEPSIDNDVVPDGISPYMHGFPVVALRDFKKGKQIYLSYNECQDSFECAVISHNFTMVHILTDFGFVDLFPRKPNIGPTLYTPIFEVDENEAGEIEFAWLTDELDDNDLDWFSDQRDRLKALEEHIEERLMGLESHEEVAIASFYRAMLDGMELASLKEPTVGKYDPLENHRDIIFYNDDLCRNRDSIPGRQAYSAKSQSIYQDIDFLGFKDRKGEKLDTCLYLDNWIHMCNSIRPHYHEWFVHYPAQFLKQVKRVLFLGGGDNMILHEVLKYPELELVVGMELDQMVVRESFKHFKTQPHFDDDRVQWWFGDAVKSLKMLPEEYLGTFDLVVVDLLSYVIEALFVTDELDILDFSMLLLNEGGILTMNEDFIHATKAQKSQYSVDLVIMEVPVFCMLTLNMFSNTVDFMTAEPTDHGVDNIVVTPGASRNDRHKFNSWWNYHRNSQHRVKEKKAEKKHASDNSQGVLLVLEAEETTIPMDSMTDVHKSVTESLNTMGLEILSSSMFGNEVLFIFLKEGYIILRSWPKHKYYAIDITLWSKLSKLYTLKRELVAATGASLTSSYNIATGGMRGIEVCEYPEFPARADSRPNDNSTCTNPGDAPLPKPFDFQDINVVLKETTALMYRNVTDPKTFVLCPPKGKSCQTLEVLQSTLTTKIGKVWPIWSCTSEESMLRDFACEFQVLDTMRSALPTSKTSGIIIDPKASRKMGHVLKEVLASSNARAKLLANQYILLAPSLSATDAWRSALLEWFRTDVTKMTPAHHAEVLFNSTTRSGQISLSIFSTGDNDFYPHLVDIIDRCEKDLGLAIEIPSVLDGKQHFMDPFKPPIIANENSYDKTPADSQWASQNPMGMQTVIQFETKATQTPVSIGEEVLRNYHEDPLTGKWFPSKVVSVNADGTFDMEDYDDEGMIEAGVERHSIRKWDPIHELTVDDGLVLVTVPTEGKDWYQGKIIEKLPNNRYKVHLHDGWGTIVEVEEEDVMRRFDAPSDLPPPEASCSKLNAMMLNAVASTEFKGTKVEIHDSAGDGCLITALGAHGSAIATWDGGYYIGLNLFTFKEDRDLHENFQETFLENTSSFTMTSRSEQPRGNGRVVNFKHEMMAVEV